MIKRALLAGLVAIATALAVSVAPAVAAPFLSIESPGAGTVTNETHPTVSGFTSDAEDPVTVLVLKEGSFFESAEAEPKPSGAWSVVLGTHLDDGEYSVEASQTETLTGEPGASGAVSFRVDTQSPEVTMNGVPSPTNDATPSFSGTAGDPSEAVTVYVFRGSSPEGSLAAKVSANASGGAWSTESVGPLADGTYTAIAEQPSSIGNKPGFSQPSTFEVHASKPKVTLNGISSPTDDRTPSFSGSASEESTVTVHIYEGSSASGGAVATAQASGTGGSWNSGGAEPALSDGEYTAVAEQESEFGNGPGKSGEIHFRVETPAPKVSLDSIAAASNDTTPSFSGTASEKTTVTVYVYAGGSAGGSPERIVTATGTGGSWSSDAVTPLGEGTYTAVAEQAGAFGNGTGTSGEIHFSVITASPHVTLNSVKSPSGNTTPSFTGSASEGTTVSIVIYQGIGTSGPKAASASAAGTGGGFTSSHASPELADGTYTAIAEQPSSFGNEAGRSNEVTFTVDTSSPTVSLNPIPSPSNDATPTFTGSASDSTTVVVHILHEGSQVATAEADGTGGGWSSGGPSKTLPSGTYTAFAEQSSSIGNPAGKSPSIGFVVNTASPVVKLNQPASRSGNTSPSFSGTGSDTTPVTVEIFKGGSLVGTVEAGAPAEGGSWSSPPVSPPLLNGTYTAVAVQASSLGNSPGHSETRTFEINTSAPAVTVVAPESPSKNRSPSFQGTASEESTVHIHILEGTTQIRELTATPSGEAWSTPPLSTPLASGRHTYKVFATQESTKEKGSGKSEELPFVVDTTSPVVSLEKVTSPSNVSAPKFNGTASDSLGVTVEIFVGTSATGSPFTTAAQTERKENEWSAVSPALPDGTYTAVAVEPSSLGNEPGRSGAVTFVINTKPPEVTLEAFKSPSNSRTPSFSGTASDTTEVFVEVLESGTKTQVAIAHASPAGGKWKAGPVTPELPAGEHSYTVVARQKSSLGPPTPEGRSAELPFVLDTLPPAVTINEVATPSNNTEPTFSGTATDSGPVKVVVKGAGKQFEAPPVPVEACATPPATPANCWTTPKGSIKLPAAKFTYTAEAIQQSSLGNPPGVTKPPIKFVVDPNAPSVTLSPVPSQMNTPTPTFTGTAGDTTPVFVSICKVSNPHCEAQHGEGAEPQSSGGGFWSATETVPLEDGEYHAIAWQKSLTGAVGATEKQTFTVDTVAPAVTVDTPGQGATVSGAAVTFHGAAGTALHDRAEVTLQLLAGSASGPAAQPPVTVTATGGAWEAKLGGVTPGEYTVRATQRDDAGNVGVALHTFHDIAPAAPTVGPTAAFSVFPPHPHTGEPVTLVSTSGDATSPITSYAWNVLGSAFAAGGQSKTTTFTSPGSHLVQLRVTDGAGLSSVASQQIPVSFPLMRPFPSVRIVTTRSGGRLHLKTLTVEAPAGATVAVTCKGKGCPVRSLSRLLTRPKGKSSGLPTVTFPRLQRALPAGIALEIRVTQRGRIGKFTRFTIRKGKLPLRADACVNGTEPKPVPCTG
jgi:hypothetical protein